MATQQKTIMNLLSPTDYQDYITLLNEFRTTNISYEEFANILHQINETGTTFVYVLREKEDGGPIIGTAKLLIEHKFYHGGKNVGHIEDVIVKSTHRGKKYGSILIKQLTDIATLLDCYKVILYCNSELVPFYNKLGFDHNQSAMINYI